jgi:hypothetical protein
MYTGVMGDFTTDNIGVSITYCHKRKLMLAILYGCSQRQMVEATRLLKQCDSTSPNIKEHPILVIGTYSELQSQALGAHTEEIITEWTQFRSQLLADRYDDAQVQRFDDRQRFLYEKIIMIENEIRTAQRCLKMIINHINTMLESGGGEYPDTTKLMKQRFEELDGIYDDLVVKCSMSSNRMSYLTNLVSLVYYTLPFIAISLRNLCS